MPYDEERMKAGLRDMVKEGKTSWSELERIFREGRETAEKKLSLSRQTIERFTNPDYKPSVRVGEQFEFFYDLLRDRVRLRPYLREPGDLAADAAALLPSALAGFFSQGHAMATLQRVLAGDYVMWRRDYNPSRVIRNGVRVSKLSMKPVVGGLQVIELQNENVIKERPNYTQTDEGYVFSHQEYAYWLTKEIETCVKLAVITKTIPMISNTAIEKNKETGMYIDSMEGHIAAFSRTARYPRARIFCLPQKLFKNLRYGIIPVDEIPDEVARRHILKDFAEEKP